MPAIEKIEGITGISHFGIVVPDIEAAFAQYSLLGFSEREEGIITESDHGIYAKVIEFNGIVLELISPIDPSVDSGYDDLLKLKRYSMDHVCYKVSSIVDVVERLKRNRFVPISNISTSLVWNKRVILLGNRKMGIIELLEDAGDLS